jgi:hypothetical protein
MWYYRAQMPLHEKIVSPVPETQTSFMQSMLGVPDGELNGCLQYLMRKYQTTLVCNGWLPLNSHPPDANELFDEWSRLFWALTMDERRKYVQLAYRAIQAEEAAQAQTATR